ncbi:MAG: hypothetical protein D6681_16225, partial [Calditrichaeota bacterium]
MASSFTGITRGELIPAGIFDLRLTIDYCRFTIRCSPFTTHHSPLTIYHSLLAIHHSPFTTRLVAAVFSLFSYPASSVHSPNPNNRSTIMRKPDFCSDVSGRWGKGSHLFWNRSRLCSGLAYIVGVLLLSLLMAISCKKNPTPGAPPPTGPDTTSHHFVWQIDTFGTENSVFFDVAVIDENNIWAVG